MAMANRTEQDTIAILEAEVWSTMPARFRHSGKTSDHSINQKLGRPLDSFIEGPVFVPEMTRLFLADIP